MPGVPEGNITTLESNIGKALFILYIRNMKAILSFLFLVLVQLTFGQEFKTSTASGVDLLAYNTFTVVRGSVLSNSEQPIDKEAFYNEIRTSIIREMEFRGYTFVEDSTAQLAVSYVIETTVKFDVQQQGRLGQQVVVTNPSSANQTSAWSREFTQGMLILEIEDSKNKNIIWSAEGMMDVSRTRDGNLLDNAVRSAYRKFPDKNKPGKGVKKKRG
ncbi:MAG: DUF4136 domain-containing protein [Cyclobacteriaceae bacterium]|nr:DUF4136 domain-containing protein [Cyclobacteriaceae bacterium]